MDDAGTRRQAERPLVDAGYDVIAAPSTQEAARLLTHPFRRSRAVDLVIAEMRAPAGHGLDGLAGLLELRAATPIILVVAALGVGVADEALRLGAAAVLRKPFDPRDLLAAVATRIHAPESRRIG